MRPEQPENAGGVQEPRAAPSSLPVGARAREQCCVQLHSLLLAFPAGDALQKAKFGRGLLQRVCLTLATRIWHFPSPHVSSHPRVSGWLRSGMAQLDVCRHRDAPTDAVPLSCLFALLIVCFSPALKHQGDGNHTAPLARSPWALAGGRVAGALDPAAPRQ